MGLGLDYCFGGRTNKSRSRRSKSRSRPLSTGNTHHPHDDYYKYSSHDRNDPEHHDRQTDYPVYRDDREPTYPRHNRGKQGTRRPRYANDQDTPPPREPRPSSGSRPQRRSGEHGLRPERQSGDQESRSHRRSGEQKLDLIVGVMKRNIVLTAGVATTTGARVSMVPQPYLVPHPSASRLIVGDLFEMTSCQYVLAGQLVPARPTEDQALNVRQMRPTPFPLKEKEAVHLHHHTRLKRLVRLTTLEAGDSLRPRHSGATLPKWLSHKSS
jgi:hypothetical protein